MITTLTGANSFGLRTELDSLVAAFIADHTDMAVERLDGEDATHEQIHAAVESLPFLTARKLVILHEPSKQKVFTERITDFISAVSEATDVLVVEPKLDRRSAYYKLLKKDTDYREFAELDAPGLARWAVTYTNGQGGTLSQANAMLLIDRIGTSQQQLANELDKLIAYDNAISAEHIMLLTEAAPHSTIFELVEAAFQHNPAKVFALYREQRALRVEPQQIIAMLGWQLHVLSVVKAAGTQSPDAVAKTAKLNPYVVKKTAAIARGIRMADLKQMVADLLHIDMRLKRESLDADEALQNYLLQLSSY